MLQLNTIKWSLQSSSTNEMIWIGETFFGNYKVKIEVSIPRSRRYGQLPNKPVYEISYTDLNGEHAYWSTWKISEEIDKIDWYDKTETDLFQVLQPSIDQCKENLSYRYSMFLHSLIKMFYK